MAAMLATLRLAGVSDRAPGDPRGVLSRPAEGPDIVLRWADHGDGLADVYLPPTPAGSPPAPLLYALHGGFWRQHYDRRQLRPLAEDLSRRGWVVVLPEYARSGGPRSAGPDTAPWPLLVDDLRAMRRRVPRLLAAVAPGKVAGGGPVVLGHSAGGQLALWWALDTAGDADPGRPRHVVALAPVADLARGAAERLGDDAVAALLGGEPEAAEHSAEADVAARLRAGERSPGCPTVVLHGADDLQVPVAHSTDLAAAVPHLDVRALPGVEHFALIDPLSPTWPTVLAALTPRTVH